MSKRKRINRGLQTSTRGVNDPKITTGLITKSVSNHSSKYDELNREFDFQARIVINNGDTYIKVIGEFQFNCRGGRK